MDKSPVPQYIAIVLVVMLIVLAIGMFFSKGFLGDYNYHGATVRREVPWVMAESSDIVFDYNSGRFIGSDDKVYTRSEIYELLREWPTLDEIIWRGVWLNALCFSVIGIFIGGALLIPHRIYIWLCREPFAIHERDRAS